MSVCRVVTLILKRTFQIQRFKTFQINFIRCSRKYALMLLVMGKLGAVCQSRKDPVDVALHKPYTHHTRLLLWTFQASCVKCIFCRLVIRVVTKLL